jgi:hypothetical protein
MITACDGDEALCQLASKSRRHSKEVSLGKCWCRVRTHLAGDEARLAITGDGAG